MTATWSPFEHRRETPDEFRRRILYVIDGPQEREAVLAAGERLLDHIGSKYKLKRRDLVEVDDDERDRRRAGVETFMSRFASREDDD